MSERVLVRREGALGRLTLNRPAQLNALDLPMIRALAGALDAWEHDDAVAAVLVDGAGERGLCAGGDVRYLYEDAARGGHEFPTLLAEEYRLDARIARYPKPYVALMDGLVMGGGVGVSAHGSVRIVTERTELAMPEVSIGNVPDVGGTWLLARAPGELGTHIALAGVRLDAADAIACGLADVCVPRGRLPELTAGLTAELAAGLVGLGEPHERHSRANLLIERAVRAHAMDPGESRLLDARGWVDDCYAADTVPEIVERLREAGRTETADAITAQSPVALVLTLRAVRDARGLALEQALEREYALTCAAVRWPDFREGVRARLVDRDGAPRWRPPTFAEVTDEVVEAFLRGARPDDPPLWT
jgi:enoyl-CoA hydratase